MVNPKDRPIVRKLWDVRFCFIADKDVDAELKRWLKAAYDAAG